jgi:hypothetical protein
LLIEDKHRQPYPVVSAGMARRRGGAKNSNLLNIKGFGWPTSL